MRVPLDGSYDSVIYQGATTSVQMPVLTPNGPVAVQPQTQRAPTSSRVPGSSRLRGTQQPAPAASREPADERPALRNRPATEDENMGLNQPENGDRRDEAPMDKAPPADAVEPPAGDAAAEPPAEEVKQPKIIHAQPAKPAKLMNADQDKADGNPQNEE
jgi:hypothetical protein